MTRVSVASPLTETERRALNKLVRRFADDPDKLSELEKIVLIKLLLTLLRGGKDGGLL